MKKNKAERQKTRDFALVKKDTSGMAFVAPSNMIRLIVRYFQNSKKKSRNFKASQSHLANRKRVFQSSKASSSTYRRRKKNT